MVFNIRGTSSSNHWLCVRAPLSGRIVSLSRLPDEVFARKMVGDGVAVAPSEGGMVAPFDGVVKHISANHHAMVLESGEGLTLLVHIGLDTVNLKGEGFRVLVSAGQRVQTGEPLLEFDLDVIARKHYSLLSPVVLPEHGQIKALELTEQETVTKGRDMLMRVALAGK